jgi:diguanylate cyclase (GGDEF)-like protein
MLEMESRIRPARVAAIAALGMGLAACGPWLGWWTLPPLIGSAVAFALADRVAKGVRRPEYAIFAAWTAAQLAIGSSIAVTAGPQSPALTVLAIPVVTLSARFSLRGVVTGVAVTLLILAVATVGVDSDALRADPTHTVLAAVAVIAIGILSTALMKSEVHYRNEVYLDPLTGMPNRRALERRAAELEEQSRFIDQPIAVIIGDIDHFKAVNDEHGHATGDAVLTAVAYLLRTQLRAFDQAYRLGGEEFLVLLPGATRDGAARVAEQLRCAIAETTTAGGLRITMSFGVGGSEAGELFDYAQVFEEADAALLSAKRTGRNRTSASLPRDRAIAATPGERTALTGA